MLFTTSPVTVRPLTYNERRQLFGDRLPGNAQVERVAHVQRLLFIPMYPTGTEWIIRENGQTRPVDAATATKLDRKFGAGGAPWSAYLGPALLGLFLIGFVLSKTLFVSDSLKPSTPATAQDQSELLALAADPAADQYYRWVNADGLATVAQLLRTTPDSVYFRYPTADAPHQVSSEKTVVRYFMEGGFDFVDVGVTRDELLNSLDATSQGAVTGLILVPGSDERRYVDRIAAIDARALKIRVNGSSYAADVRRDWAQFAAAEANIDSTLLYTDSASHRYFEELYQTAKGDKDQARRWLSQQPESSSVTLAHFLYTKAMYTKDVPRTDSMSRDERVRDLGFLLKLTNQGLWLLDFGSNALDNVRIEDVFLTGPRSATVAARSPSNILQPRSTIDFVFDMYYENGRWCVNVPSTFAYTQQQIMQATDSGRDRGYRKQLKSDLQELVPEATWLDDWLY